ncbi:MarR family winged helix-turn-helix transcriptional regulator ['Paenibacillus yunnanensis' Narsing Rao et al. 2020]|uniref:MarR family winged helix-turn-helix transcriptional regulator n=1 Tax=Paenibacillus tengchongensis TaxID=2608684 RepID=UPI00124D2C04|nr:MarR family transcriptional regulator [Paenibacillus tengchongensis]
MDSREQLSHLISKHMLTLVASYTKLLDPGLTAPQYFILQSLAKQDMQTSSSFAAMLGVSLSAITNLTGKLVQKGYIERIASESDRRQVYMKITDSGRAVEEQMLARYKVLTEGVWDDFSDQELSLLIEAYQKMIGKLEQQNGSVKPHSQEE